LSEYGDKIPADKKKPIEDALNELKEAHKAQNVPAIDAAIEKMNKMWEAASKEMYQATQEQQTQTGNSGDAPGNEPPAGGNDEVTDVDFEEVKDDKK